MGGCVCVSAYVCPPVCLRACMWPCMCACSCGACVACLWLRTRTCLTARRQSACVRDAQVVHSSEGPLGTQRKTHAVPGRAVIALMTYTHKHTHARTHTHTHTHTRTHTHPRARAAISWVGALIPCTPSGQQRRGLHAPTWLEHDVMHPPNARTSTHTQPTPSHLSPRPVRGPHIPPRLT